MNQFSAAELAELFFIREGTIDLQFQFWITITFSAIVASFVAGKHLSRRLRAVVALLYSLAVVVLISRWYYAAVQATLFSTQLAELGVTLGFPWITMISRVILVALGTTVALVFLLSKGLREETDE